MRIIVEGKNRERDRGRFPRVKGIARSTYRVPSFRGMAIVVEQGLSG